MTQRLPERSTPGSSHARPQRLRAALLAAAFAAMLAALTAQPAAAVPPAQREGYAFPRGDAPPYGWISSGDRRNNQLPRLQEGYSLWHISYGPFVLNRALSQFSYMKEQGRQGSFISYIGGERLNCRDSANRGSPYCRANFWDEQFKSLYDRGIRDSDLLGFYYTDELWNRDQLELIDQARRRYFPEALAMGSVNSFYPNLFAAHLDVQMAQAYPGDNPPGFAYLLLAGKNPGARYGDVAIGIVERWRNEPAWRDNPRKAIYGIVQAFGGLDGTEYCTGADRSVNLNTPQKAYDRVQVQVVIQALSGTQGVLAYWLGKNAADWKTRPAAGTYCEIAFYDFKPMYTAIWPWIRTQNRVELPVQITAGPAQGEASLRVQNTRPPRYTRLPFPAILAAQFSAPDGSRLVLVANGLQPANYRDAGRATTTATVLNLPNGTWEELRVGDAPLVPGGDMSARRPTVKVSGTRQVTNGTLSVELGPYQFLILRQAGTAVDRGSRDD